MWQRTPRAPQFGSAATAVLLLSAALVGCDGSSGDGSSGGAAPDATAAAPAGDAATDPTDPGGGADVGRSIGSPDTGPPDASVGDSTDASDDVVLDLTHSVGTATVVVDGTTYRFGAVAGSVNVCTNLRGSLQVALPMLDETGAAVDGSELTLELIEAGSDADTRGQNTPSFQMVTPDMWVAGNSMIAGMLNVEPPPIELVPNGAAASGTLTVVNPYEPSVRAEAQLDVRCD